MSKSAELIASVCVLGLPDSVMGVYFFRELDPANFGLFSLSFVTMFRYACPLRGRAGRCLALRGARPRARVCLCACVCVRVRGDECDLPRRPPACVSGLVLRARVSGALLSPVLPAQILPPIGYGPDYGVARA